MCTIHINIMLVVLKILHPIPFIHFFFHPADSLHYLIYMCIIMFCISVHLFYKQFGNWCDKFIVYMYQIISCLFKLESKEVKAIYCKFYEIFINDTSLAGCVQKYSNIIWKMYLAHLSQKAEVWAFLIKLCLLLVIVV